jgi:hypothetical protein
MLINAAPSAASSANPTFHLVNRGADWTWTSAANARSRAEVSRELQKYVGAATPIRSRKCSDAWNTIYTILSTGLCYIEHWSFLFDFRIILLTGFSKEAYVNAY